MKGLNPTSCAAVINAMCHREPRKSWQLSEIEIEISSSSAPVWERCWYRTVCPESQVCNKMAQGVTYHPSLAPYTPFVITGRRVKHQPRRFSTPANTSRPFAVWASTSAWAGTLHVSSVPFGGAHSPNLRRGMISSRSVGCCDGRHPRALSKVWLEMSCTSPGPSCSWRAWGGMGKRHREGRCTFQPPWQHLSLVIQGEF
jgi:hypothetical protein